jgi:proteasome lid subunit RPN8/RPN11
MKNKLRLKRWTKPQPRREQTPPWWEDDWWEEEPVPTAKALRFSPRAWAKLLYFRDKSPNEVGGFGITEPQDLLLVTDFLTVRQEVTAVSVKFDDEAVSQFFEEQVDLGRQPEQFARIWLHTHPGDSPEPSTIDEQTFQRVFGGCQWAVMAVVAQDDSTCARLHFNIGPGSQILIPTAVDFSGDFGGTDHGAWDVEYEADVQEMEWLTRPALPQGKPVAGNREADPPAPCDILKEFERMDPVQRQLLLDDLADRPELWNGEEVCIL